MIFIVQQKLAPYRIPFYLKLSRKVDIRVIFSEFENMTKKDLIGVEHLFIKSANRKIIFLKKVFSWMPLQHHITKYNPKKVVFELSNSNVTLLGYVLMKPFLSFKIVTWGHGYFRKDKSGTRKIPRMVKKFIANSSDSVIVYTGGGKKFLNSIGISNNKIHVAWNAVNVGSSLSSRSIDQRFSASKLLYMGRLIPEKKPDVACQILIGLLNKGYDFSLDIVGSGPLEESLKEKYGHIHNIRFLGSIIDEEEISNILNQNSSLLNPGYLGLNIVHAIAHGLPVIAPADGVKCIHHSPEYEYIENTNCFIGIKGIDIEYFIDGITNLFSNATSYSASVTEAYSIAKEISIDRMVDGYVEGLYA